jgi:hypothetical protein
MQVLLESQSNSKTAFILGLVLSVSMISLILFYYCSNNRAFGQINDNIGPGSESIGDNNIISSAIPLASDQIPTIPQQSPSIGFVANGTIDSVILVPNNKWIASGNWSMILNNGNVTFFETNMNWYNSRGTNAHTHELVNFGPADGEQVVSLQQPSNNIVLKGVTDVGTNSRIVWNKVPTTISINGHKIITISLDDNKTNHHFAG